VAMFPFPLEHYATPLKTGKATVIKEENMGLDCGGDYLNKICSRKKHRKK